MNCFVHTSMAIDLLLAEMARELFPGVRAPYEY
jgi:hypothetical protein